MWHELAVAICLMLVIEGIIPFLAPGRWRTMLEAIEQVDDNTIRLVGLGSMLVGAGILYLIS